MALWNPIVAAKAPPLVITTKERKFTGGRGEVKFFATLRDGTPVGEMFVNFGNVKIKGVPAASIFWIGVEPEFRGMGIATKLYEAAQRLACERGRVLASDVTLKEGSRGFWEKQRAKGRATRHREKVAGKPMFRYALSCPATSLNPPAGVRIDVVPSRDRTPYSAFDVVATLDGKVVGELLIDRRSTAPGAELFVAVAEVDESVRRQGIGTALYLRAAEEAKKRGSQLHSGTMSDYAAKLWKSMIRSGKAREDDEGYVMNPATRTKLRVRILDRGEHGFVVRGYVGRRAVGHVAAVRSYRTFDVVSAEVEEASRKQGIGRRLYEAAHEEALRRGLPLRSQGFQRSRAATGVWRAVARDDARVEARGDDFVWNPPTSPPVQAAGTIGRLVVEGWSARSVEQGAAWLRAALEGLPVGVTYLVAPGGFLTVSASLRGVPAGWASRVGEIGRFRQIAEGVVEDLLRAAPRGQARFFSFGLDVRDPNSPEHVELVVVADLDSRRIAHLTAKTYPTADQENTLVREVDWRAHLWEPGNGDRVLVLGCHDLNVFNNRGLKAAAKGGSGAARHRTLVDGREVFVGFDPTHVLHHPHGTDVAGTWRVAWSGASQLLPHLVQGVSGIAHPRFRGRPNDDLAVVLAATQVPPCASVDLVVLGNDRAVGQQADAIPLDLDAPADPRETARLKEQAQATYERGMREWRHYERTGERLHPRARTTKPQRPSVRSARKGLKATPKNSCPATVIKEAR
ncbi:MAG: GNAT family N-acetyltransferase [Deltaproteobacteria bacterium]|nr:GNAT family N-acetyltransferase [Deltaproteobacteria bacterium]